MEMERRIRTIFFMLFCLGGLLWAGCAVHVDPVETEVKATEGRGEGPDYALAENWAWFGIGKDKAADLFIVCPTVDMRDEMNLSLGDGETKKAFVGALEMERGIYEDTARLYAPFYRQAAIKAYGMPEGEREAALAFAYRDVSAAFRRYLEAENALWERLPDWSPAADRLLVNHMFYNSFPHVGGTSDGERAFEGLCAVYAFVKFVTVGCLIQREGREAAADVLSQLGRLVEHSDLKYRAAQAYRRQSEYAPGYWRQLVGL